MWAKVKKKPSPKPFKRLGSTLPMPPKSPCKVRTKPTQGQKEVPTRSEESLRKVRKKPSTQTRSRKSQTRSKKPLSGSLPAGQLCCAGPPGRAIVCHEHRDRGHQHQTVISRLPNIAKKPATLAASWSALPSSVGTGSPAAVRGRAQVSSCRTCRIISPTQLSNLGRLRAVGSS